jgi:protein-S-isoprenylcysteine O-methyltransferase Ste14
MLYLLRHLLSVLLLPTTVVVVIPLWIARRWHVVPDWPGSRIEWMAAASGLAAGVIGLTLFGSSLRRFASEGRGTLAPWDPPRRLVIRGPYRYVRNPMISGVGFMLAGLALCLRSRPHGMWAALFGGLNMLFIPLIEEPLLEARFGDDYRTYRRAVPRFIPLLKPWKE